MTAKGLTKTLRRALTPVEQALLGKDYFSLQDYLSFSDRFKVVQRSWWQKWLPSPESNKPEISFVLYSKACERLLVPLLARLLKQQNVQSGEIRVNCIVLENIHQLRLTTQTRQQLTALNCEIQTTYLSLIRACHAPKNKLVVVCLDHQSQYEFHKCGVDTVNHLKATGVKTVCIQHGGTRSDSVAELSSSASDLILVWGRRVEREMHLLHHLPPERVRAVGNPLHDRLMTLDIDKTRALLTAQYPHLQDSFTGKKILLLAACLHTEYRGYGDEGQLYRTYIRHLYNSLDFSKVLLLVKMHPLDSKAPNLYQEAAAELPNSSGICIIEPEQVELDVYGLLSISDLLLTRCSTVAEEALMLGKPVIAFDLFEQGPSIGYKHLEEYGSYRTVYASPTDALKREVEEVLFTPTSLGRSQADIIADLTLALDGNSTDRGVNVLLEQVMQTAPAPADVSLQSAVP
jgi:hypothetical protein